MPPQAQALHRTMTLVDLPGLARVPVGDQPTDIEARIRAMITEYIKHPTCVILAVSPANVDLVNSDAIEMARCVDPEGLRTLGAATQPKLLSSSCRSLVKEVCSGAWYSCHIHKAWTEALPYATVASQAAASALSNLTDVCDAQVCSPSWTSWTGALMLLASSTMM